MHRLRKTVSITTILFALFGCAPQRHYVWSDYDQKLYNNYKKPAEKEEFRNAIKEAVAEAESENKVPPGIFAEYGFLLYEQGNSLEAIRYFQKEADKWPESKFFMQKMISMAEKRNKPKSDSKSLNSTQAANPVTEVTR